MKGGRRCRITVTYNKLLLPHNSSTSYRYSDAQHRIRKYKRLKLTFGIHPRLIILESGQQINKWLVDLEITIGAKGVVAIGECGLDQQIYTRNRLG